MANLFASDLHLEDQRPDILRAFFRLLDERKKDLQQIYLLGDIFEVWLGDDTPSACADALAEKLSGLAREGIEIFLLHGNRDFLLGPTYAARCGATLLQKQEYIMDVTPDEVLATLRDLNVELLIHGHTHRPAVHDLLLDGKAVQRIVLGDWHTQGWYLLADDNNIQLKSFPFSGE